MKHMPGRHEHPDSTGQNCSWHRTTLRCVLNRSTTYDTDSLSRRGSLQAEVRTYRGPWKKVADRTSGLLTFTFIATMQAAFEIHFWDQTYEVGRLIGCLRNPSIPFWGG